MHRFLRFVLPVVTVTLTGCQHLNSHSPYQYRFDDGQVHAVCVSVSPRDNEALRLSVLQMLKEQGLEVREVSTFDSECSGCLKFDFKVEGWNNRVVAGRVDYRREVHGVFYSAQAVERLPEAMFGTPDDDDRVLIRMLLIRIFPQPGPWKE